MNDCGDTFLGLAVLLGVKEGGEYKIEKIANQRVKESNRIRGMVTNLVKCGIFCHETPDGIRVIGRPIEYF